MLDPNNYSFCSEFYIVEKTVEVVVEMQDESRYVRIEALRERDGHYSTRAYIQDRITVQPTNRQAGGETARPPTELWVWADLDLPWTHLKSADDVLAQALSFLSERCAKK